MVQSLRTNSQFVARHFANIWQDSGLKKEAVRLSDLATHHKLAIFAGAGVSIGAGLPLWDDLLEQLAAEAQPAINTSGAEWRYLDALTKADVIDKRTPTSIGQQLQELFRKFYRPSLQHSLLAGRYM